MRVAMEGGIEVGGAESGVCGGVVRWRHGGRECVDWQPVARCGVAPVVSVREWRII